jgi:RNA polymerase sigma-70 factor (ECF subfamily)
MLVDMIGHSGGYYGVEQEQAADSRRGVQLQGSSGQVAPAPLADEVLMAAYLKGDMSAFAELFRRYTPVLERLLWRSLRDEVPDFVQQTFLHVHRARHTFAEGALFRPWVVSIAINLKHEHFRRMNRRLAIHPDVFTFGARRPSEPDTIYEADQAWRAIESLPARERQVLELLCGGGLSAADVAAEMRTTTAGVKSLAHRARQRLRGNQGPGSAQPASITMGMSGSSKYPSSVR